MNNKFSPEELNKRAEPEQIEKAVQILFDYLRIKDSPEKSDVIFILGDSSKAPAEKAFELYKAGYSPYIAFTGIRGTFTRQGWDKSETEVYREILRALDVPEESIISKEMTRNTLEEAREAIPFLNERGIDPRKVILVAIPVHQRRAFATFQKQHPDVQYINCPTDEPLDLNDLETKKRLVGEIERLLDYSKKGDIQKQEIPYAVLRTTAFLRAHLKTKGEYTERQKPTK